MTSFASAFGSSEHEDNYSNNKNLNDLNNYQNLSSFSNIDLDQQVTTSSKEYYSPYPTLNNTSATLQTDTSSTAGAILNNPSRIPRYSTQEYSSSMIKCLSRFFSLKILFR